MCSLQFKGVLGDVGFEFGNATGGKPPVLLDAADMRQELGTSVERDTDGDDLLLGTHANPLLAGCPILAAKGCGFSTQRVAWPLAYPEKEMLLAPASGRDVHCGFSTSLTVDEDSPAYAEVACRTAEEATWYLDGAFEDDFWAAEERLHGAGEGGLSGEDMLRAMECDAAGLTPPGWSAPLLVSTDGEVPLCGAAAGDVTGGAEPEEGSAAAGAAAVASSTLRHAKQKYFTKAADVAQLVAEGKMAPARARAPAPVARVAADDALDKEIAEFDMSALGGGGGGEAEKEEVRREWSSTALLDVSEFAELVPQPAVTWPFELDGFQKQAVARIERNENVFVAAHTSAGKTVAAEYAIGLALQRGTRVLYTSPIKTLSNQKYRDFKERFGDDVGILTGDVQINPGASCLVMTTEILRSALYQQYNSVMGGITGMESSGRGDILDDVEYVIFDEVHYVNDQSRGYVWEEVIILLPKTVRLVMLSATVPNHIEFADWVGRTRQSIVHVLSTYKRPVPLEYAILAGDKEFNLVRQGEREFRAAGYKQYVQHVQVKAGTGGSGGGKGGRFLGREARMRNEAREWRAMIRHLAKRERLPLIVFAFSKARIDDLSDHLGSMNFTSKGEKAAIEAFLRNAMKRLKGNDRSIPQVQKVFRLLKNGLAVHHAGLMPIIKEVVEDLFCKGFIRVLFATETFAMGVNAPARCVIFADTHKFDGAAAGKRPLQPGEFTQMAGRAGRRGKDTVGYVYLYATASGSGGAAGSAAAGSTFVGNMPGEAVLQKMLTGKPVQLTSKFRLTYSMVLNALMSQTHGRRGSFGSGVGHENHGGEVTSSSAFISHLLRHSFAESKLNKYFPVYKALQAQYEAATLCVKEEMDKLTEGAADRMLDVYETACDLAHGSRVLVARQVTEMKAATALLHAGRVVVVEIAPMAFTVGFVVKMQGVQDMGCVVLLLDEDTGDDGEPCADARGYDAAALLVPSAALQARGRALYIDINRNKIIAVLEKTVGGGGGGEGSVDARRVGAAAAAAAPPQFQQMKKKDDGDSFFGGGKKKGKDDKKGGMLPMPMMPKPAAAAGAGAAAAQGAAGAAVLALLNNREKLLEFGEAQLKAVLKDGFDAEKDVAWGAVATPEAAETRAAVREDAARLFECGTVHGEDMALAHRRSASARKAAVYARLASDDALYLMPEFKGRLSTLAALGMVESSAQGGGGEVCVTDVYTVLPKGQCASIIASMDSVIATELIFEGFFDDLTPQQVAAALSCFVYVARMKKKNKGGVGGGG